MKSLNYLQQISEGSNFFTSPWGGCLLRNCDEFGDLLEFNSISAYETYKKEQRTSLWLYMKLKIFQIPNRFDIFAIFLCPQCESMTSMDGLQANQNPEDIKAKMCFHTVSFCYFLVFAVFTASQLA